MTRDEIIKMLRIQIEKATAETVRISFGNSVPGALDAFRRMKEDALQTIQSLSDDEIKANYSKWRRGSLIANSGHRCIMASYNATLAWAAIELSNI